MTGAYLQACNELKIPVDAKCSNYCASVVNPVLSQAMALQQKIDECNKQTNTLETLKQMQLQLKEQFAEHEIKIEGQLMTLQRQVDRDVNQSVDILTKFDNIGEQFTDLQAKIGGDRTEPQGGSQFQKIGSKYYYLSQEVLNWFAASDKCRAIGGFLVNFENQAEFDAVVSHLKPNHGYWIGINDHGKEGEYHSVATGRPATYFNWESGNPDDRWPSEDCVELWYHHGKHLMNDFKCSKEKHFICEPATNVKE